MPVNLSVVARMFDIKVQRLYRAYKEVLSDYRADILSKKWKAQKIESVSQKSGEVIEKPLYVFEPQNVGERMAIDDKAIGRDGFTVFSNNETGKIALLLESTKSEDVQKSLSLFGDKLLEIKSVTSDMSAGYLLAVSEQIPAAQRVIDKFHLMQYVYDVPLSLRSKIQKELREKLSDGKEKTAADKLILNDLDLLQRCRYRLTQSPEKWSEAGAEQMKEVFKKYPKLELAYHLTQKLKRWYDKSRCKLSKKEIRDDLYFWYKEVKMSGITEFSSVIKTFRKHEYEILNYFSNDAQTNAKAERLNGKISRFVAANYGLKDKDFALWRIAKYFS